MRTLLRSALTISVVAGALLAAAPAHAKTVCTTAPNGARVCYDDGSGGVAPGAGSSGTVGAGSDDVAQIPARPAPEPAEVPLAPPPVFKPAPVLKPAVVPAPKAPAPAAPAPAQVNVPAPAAVPAAQRKAPAAPAIVPNQAVLGIGPAGQPAPAAAPAEAAPAEAATETAVAAVPSASATPSPSATTAPAEPAPVERAAETQDSPAAFFGVLALLVFGGAFTWRQIKATKARRAEYDAYEASKK